MTRPRTIMGQEAGEAAEACAVQLGRNAALMREVGARLRATRPLFAATVARGSSDQAAGFAKFLFETVAGVPTLSQAPSIASLYHATSPNFRHVPVVAISQSGRSPDLLAAAEEARQRGALVIAVVNDAESPLARDAEIVIPIHAGPERGVAATKSFICTLVAIAHLTAAWTGAEALAAALKNTGELLAAAARADWSPAVAPLVSAKQLLVLGRGPTLPLAGEAALKFKETCNLACEAFSSAEVAHGPMTLVGPGSPVMAFGPRDAARAGLQQRLADFADRGALVIASGQAADIAPAGIVLPSVDAHPVLAAIAQIQSFYGFVNALALARGLDPDAPPHLNKVTRTT